MRIESIHNHQIVYDYSKYRQSIFYRYLQLEVHIATVVDIVIEYKILEDKTIVS